MSELLNAALRLAAHGFNVIPIRPDYRKRPALAGWKRYQEQRTTETELRRWFGERSSCGLAVVCGRVSRGLVVVDVDDHELAERFLDTNPGLLESTLCARTGGGNLHVYLRVPWPPAKFSLRRHDPPLPIDIQGEGSYVVAPPSLHASGRCYEWLPGCGREVLAIRSLSVWLQGALGRAGVCWSPRGDQPRYSHPVLPDSHASAEIIALLQRLTGESGRQRGDEVWFTCPHHADSVASLSANVDRPVWHCFGCDEGGGLGRLRELAGAH